MRYLAGQEVVFDNGLERHEVLILSVDEAMNYYVGKFPTGNFHFLESHIDHEATKKLMNQNKKQSKYQEAVERIEENTKQLASGLGTTKEMTVDRYIFTIGSDLSSVVVYGSSYTREGNLLTISSSHGDSIFDLDHYKRMTSRLNPDYVENNSDDGKIKTISIGLDMYALQCCRLEIDGNLIENFSSGWHSDNKRDLKIINIKVL